ncbi:hypothetical protein BLA29_015202 [Euroglyphus maynei]|uniref:Uncharacterized protein n=1 Tax=Euroglyphus maynei TaxID=6958 RepID=A0A1Y3BDQ0_EURMA|nr:hypothetical protein BLA29_015202 [Euroglyphus maynei]
MVINRMKRIVIFHHVLPINFVVRMPYVYRLNGVVMAIPIVMMQMMN